MPPQALRGSTTEPPDPVCAIHGLPWSEHDGGRCLYCCICFKPLTPDECAEDSDGQAWDVCKGRCAEEAGLLA
jgi:hypothetical protein